MEYTDITHKLRQDYWLIIGSVAVMILLAAAQIMFGRDVASYPLIYLDITVVVLFTAVIMTLYSSLKLSLLIGAAAVTVVTYVNHAFPYFTALLVGGSLLVFFFLIRMKTENERLIRAEQEKERELQKAMKELERMGQRKDEILFTASHDLRTPVSIIRSNLATIQDGYAGKVSKEAHIYIDAAYRASDRLRHLLEDILEASAVEHKDEVVLRPVQMEEVVAAIVESHAKDNTHVQIISPKRPYKTPKVWADQQMLRRALENLIINALKYTKKGHVIIDVEQKDRKVICHIKDTGIGIAPDEQELLFTKFYRGSNAASTSTRGTGLGLYITKQIIQRMRGRIHFSSQVNKGTTFHVELPVVKR